MVNNHCLVVSNILCFSIQLGISSSQLLLTPRFFRGVGLNHQPAYVISIYNILCSHHTTICNHYYWYSQPYSHYIIPLLMIIYMLLTTLFVIIARQSLFFVFFYTPIDQVVRLPGAQNQVGRPLSGAPAAPFFEVKSGSEKMMCPDNWISIRIICFLEGLLLLVCFCM